jgi:hypothetical protein
LQINKPQLSAISRVVRFPRASVVRIFDDFEVYHLLECDVLWQNFTNVAEKCAVSILSCVTCQQMVMFTVAAVRAFIHSDLRPEVLQILRFVDRASQYNHVQKSQLDAQLILSIFRQPLHVSGGSRPSRRRSNRMYITIGTYTF